MTVPEYPFLREAGRILNAGQARSLLLTGNIHDLFHLSPELGEADYVPLYDFLVERWSVPGLIIVVYEINGPVRMVREDSYEKLKDAWLRWRTGLDDNQLAIRRMLASKREEARVETQSRDFDSNLRAATGNPTVALEFLRQLCLCSRTDMGGQPALREDLLIIIEAADLIMPEGEIPNLSDADRHRVSICHDWFSDPGFSAGGDSVVLICESRSQLNQRVARLPQMLEVQIPIPPQAARAHYIDWFLDRLPSGKSVQLWGSREELAASTAGLSLHALRQLLVGASHESSLLSQADVIDKVEQYIQAQLGGDMVEFKKPSHQLDAVVGFSRLKEFIRGELLPRFGGDPAVALPGAAVCGAIGSGKTFIFEAVAAELDMVVLVLKNIRSQWFGQTDVLFERLRRVLEALNQVLIFVDEADTQFGGIGPETHSTERRLTGKIQAMMSDPRLRGRVTWLLMTARIHLLSPDIRRPGRVGDLIIPILDPEDEDRRAFLQWMTGGGADKALTGDEIDALDRALGPASAATFAALRSELRAKRHQAGGDLDAAAMLAVMEDHIPPAIEETRRYQTLQALINCTRRSLLPSPEAGESERQAWAEEVRRLEARGIR